jgi:hypothetical protein
MHVVQLEVSGAIEAHSGSASGYWGRDPRRLQKAPAAGVYSPARR